MCRFNLILVKEKEAKEILLSEGFDKVFDELMGYMAFQKGYCNCDSFVGTMCDKKELGYDSALEVCKKEKLEQLYQVREIMNQPGYKEKKQEFEKQRMKFIEEMEIFNHHILDYELEQMEIIEENYSGEEYMKKTEELYHKIDELQKEVDNNITYQTKQNSYFEFLQKNKLMEDSTCYYLSEEEEEEARGEAIPLEELFGEDFQILDEDLLEDEDIMEMEETSSVINKVIEREENNTFKNEIDEYNSYYKVFTKLLSKVDSLFFATIWSEPNQLKKVKDIDINSLIIDDLAFLEYDEMVCVTRYY